MNLGGENMYSGFWKRFIGFWIDRIFLSSIVLLTCFILKIPSSESLIYSGINPYKLYANSSNTNALYVWIFIILLPWLYYGIFESSYLKATPGKIVLKMVITDLNENRISFGSATVRYFGKYISSAIVGIGFLMVFFTQRKQSLHDIIAKTVVIDR
jgi:uncharacterized RDD family membrane protein YckC